MFTKHVEALPISPTSQRLLQPLLPPMESLRISFIIFPVVVINEYEVENTKNASTCCMS
jgi:hypothetical protein